MDITFYDNNWQMATTWSTVQLFIG